MSLTPAAGRQPLLALADRRSRARTPLHLQDDWIWARYPDGYDVWLGDGSTKQVGEDELILGKTWKLNAERNNGRAAMMGITGMIIHEALTGNPVFPIGETL